MSAFQASGGGDMGGGFCPLLMEGDKEQRAPSRGRPTVTGGNAAAQNQRYFTAKRGFLNQNSQLSESGRVLDSSMLSEMAAGRPCQQADGQETFLLKMWLLARRSKVTISLINISGT